MELITVDMAAQRLGISPGMVKVRIKNGDLKAFKYQRSWVIDEESLQENFHQPDRRKVPAGSMSVQDAAEELGITAWTVRRFINEGKLIAHKEGKPWVLDPDSVAAYKARS